MTRMPLTLEDLDELIDRGLEAADDEVRAAWDAMRIMPEKWQCSPWGDHGGGFWVVAEKDGHVVWYNDIEDGFNTSRFAARGTIDEYACNQTTFEEFLLNLPEAKKAEAWGDNLATGLIPSELQGGGTIVRRQTTYCTIRSSGGSYWRLHFKSKAEMRYVEPHFSKLEIVDAHPILEQYNEPWADLFFTGSPSNPATLVAALAERVSAASAGWRNIDEYLNSSANLIKGYGLLMHAPTTIVRNAITVLSEMRLKTSTVKSFGPGGDYRAAIMDRNVVVAQSFRFDRVDGSHATQTR